MKKYYAGSLQRIIKLLFFLFLSGSVQAQELVVFKGASDKYGYKNTAGAVVIPAKYQQAEEFGYEELAGVKYNSKWGMVDKKGKEVVQPKYDRLGKDKQIMFLSGHLEVQLNGKWGLIDEQGREVVPPKYEDVHVSDNNKGYFAIELNNKWGFVNRAGQNVIPPKYEDAYYFENDIAIVQLNKKWGAVDVTGKEAIAFRYDELAYTYQIGKPTPWLLAQSSGKWGFINTNGTVKIPLVYQHIKEYRINYSDNPADTSLMEPEGHFVYGLDMVERNGKWGAVNTDGNEIIPIKYQDIINEPDHNAIQKGALWFKIKLDGKWGLVDQAGNELIAPQYPTALFQYDMNAVKKTAESKQKNVSANYTNAPTKTDVQITKQVPGMKGIVDSDLVGTWKSHDDADNTNTFYIFRADGTFDHWSDMVTPTAPSANYKNFWRINGEVLELLPEARNEVVHIKTLKRNDPATNSPALVIEWNNSGYYKTFFPTQAKEPWNISVPKTNKQAENKTVVPEKLVDPPVKLSGVVDLAIVGLWKTKSNNIDYYLDFKADGTYGTYASHDPKVLKCYWRIDNGFINTFCDGSKQVSRYTFRKTNDLASGKPTISLGGSTYFPEADREMWK